jgi:hypothetical protein
MLSVRSGGLLCRPGIEAGQKATSLRAASMEEVSLQSLPRADNSQQLGAQLRKARSEGDSGAAAAAPPAPGSSSGEPAGPRSAYAGFAPQEQVSRSILGAYLHTDKASEKPAWPCLMA